MGFLIAFMFFLAASPAYAQQAPPPPPAQSGAPLPPQQLDDLVAPIALYPDPLVAQILAASTYPMEIAEAQQWLHDHPNWHGRKLMDEAKKQNWDPSIQGLVAFPDVLAQLTQDMTWTTQLGDAFLGQQTDVMQAIQRMRAQAQQRGTLQSTPQESVSTQEQNGQPAITIEPTNPDVWYVPNYNPAYVWGAPVWGAYPPLLYPSADLGFGWWPGIDVGLYFGDWGGWGWGGWGWNPNWYGGGIFVDHSFFHRFGFHDWQRGGYLGRTDWAHNPAHRLGVPYGNPRLTERFGQPGAFRGSAFGGGANRAAARPQNLNRGAFGAGQRFGTQGFEQRGFTQNHSVFGGYHNGGMTRMQSDRGFSSMGARGGFSGGGMRGGGGFGGGRGGRR